MLRRSRELFADILRQTDLVLLALCAAASLFGVLMVASATRYMPVSYTHLTLPTILLV